jgi:hypothetical protein
MSNRKEFEKVTSESPSRKDMPKHPDSKTQPSQFGFKESRTGAGAEGNFNGDGHDHNWKGRSVNTAGSDYHDGGRPTSGLHGNFAEKDASMEYLRERNRSGQEVRHYSGTNEQSRLKTFGGATGYDTTPIPEVYKSATSQGEVPPNAVEYKTNKKDRNADMPDQQNVESSSLTSRITKHIKNK